MHPTRRHSLAALAATLASPFVATSARAQAQPAAFPSRAITLMVPWPAGAPSDAMARRLQVPLQKAFGQPVLVENLGGAGGSLGVARLMQMPADGHAMLVGTPTELVLSPLTMPAVRYKADDFSLLASFGRVAYVLCCRAGLPAANLAELLRHAASADKPLSIGHIGPGSLIQLMSLDLQKTAKLSLTLVPYRGVPPMMQDVAAGQVDLCFLPLAGHTVTLLEQGRIRALGVSTPRPSTMFPNFPTLVAGDKRFERFDYDVWGGLLVRRETPPEVQQRLHAWWLEMTRDAEFLAWSRSTGSDPVPALSLAEAGRFYAREVDRYSTLLRAFPEALRG
ncbi:MAG: tripartite tricarboxylate transporter substrate binding protein [Rubrivivax sp.]|nr:tripartite tricarboxylate transporter substrate binding protein [Rubrivivax sp.]